MLSLPLKATQQKREWETILHIAQQNGNDTQTKASDRT